MIEFRGVTKIFPGNITAVNNISFRAKKGEVIVILGRSGCGKTTSLKMANRLIEPTGGRILINGRDNKEWDDIELRRSMGYVIQDIGLFPHLTVGENVGLVPRLKRWDRESIDKRVREMLDMVGLHPERFINRYPKELSGGQRQRVGVARALASNPEIILMDEPFGALDPLTREDLQDEFLGLQSLLKKTIIFITHDIFEAVKICDRMAIMNKGVIEQIDRPLQILQSPANEFVDRFVGRHRAILSGLCN